jgi:hypothetical protein
MAIKTKSLKLGGSEKTKELQEMMRKRKRRLNEQKT